MSTLPPTQCDCCAQSPPEVLRSHARGGMLLCLRCHLYEGACCWLSAVGIPREATNSDTIPHDPDGAPRDPVGAAHGGRDPSQ
jgi:hypothetical protein